MPWPGVIVFVLPPGPVEFEPILFPKAMVNTQWLWQYPGKSNAPILDLLGHSQERLLDVGRTLRGGLKEGDVQLVGEVLHCRNERGHYWPCKGGGEGATDLCHSVLDDFLRGQVGLVAHKQLVDTLRGIPVDLLQPLFYVGERICRR